MIRVCRREPQTSPFTLIPALISWKRDVRICAALLGIAFVCARGVCQSSSETTPSFQISARSIETSSPDNSAFHSEAADQEDSPDGMQLSLQQAIRMALENNLDIRLEQIDQSVADFSITRTEGGAIPRSINYDIAETPAGVLLTPLPLLDSTASTFVAEWHSTFRNHHSIFL
jgi:hypothetical protein